MPDPNVVIARTNVGEYEDAPLLKAFGLGEVDPNGISQHEKGAKLDVGKPDVGLLFESFPNALMAVAEVATFGAAKYTRGGWKEVPGGLMRYAAAHGRHMLYRYMGEITDKDSGKLHRAHEAWNVLAQLEYVLTGREAQ